MSSRGSTSDGWLTDAMREQIALLDAAEPGWRERVRAEAAAREASDLERIAGPMRRAEADRARGDAQAVAIVGELSRGSRGLWLHGRRGDLKRLADDVAALWREGGRRCLVLGWRDLRDALHADEPVRARMEAAPLLVLSLVGEFGVDRWGAEVAAAACDARSARGLPTVVTSTLTPSQLAASAAGTLPGESAAAFVSALRSDGAAPIREIVRIERGEAA